MFKAVPVGACAVLVALAHDAGASASSRLVYARADAAARCPGEHDLRAAVASRLGYDPFFPWAEQTISIDVTESSGKLLARLKLVDRDGIARGERELTAPVEDCVELIASLSIAISITLDPMHAASADPPVPVAAPAEPAQTNAPPDRSYIEPAPHLRAPSPDERLPRTNVAPSGAGSFSAYAGPLLTLEAEPGASFGARAGLGFRGESWSTFVEARADLPAKVTPSAAGVSPSSGFTVGGAAHSKLWGGATGACWRTSFFSNCGLVLLGQLTAHASDLAGARNESMFYAAAGARIQGTLPLSSKFELLFHLDGLKTLTPVTLYLGRVEAWQTPAFSAAAGAAASVRFP